MRWFLSAILISAGVLSAAGHASARDKIKIGSVDFAPASGSSWVRANAEGFEYLKKHDPDVEVTRVESIPEGPAVRSVIRNLVNQGNKVIFANGYGYGVFVPDLAKEFPDVYFLVEQANPEGPDNLGTYYGNAEEARYLEGVIAGSVTKSNIVGFVGAFPISPVISGVNAFALGARSVNPDIRILVNWANTWYDPAKEKESAEALLNAGADVIANHEDSPATLQAAAARGKLGMTSNADWSSAAPDAFLTGSVWNWGPYYVQVIDQIRNGKFEAGRFMGTLANGVVGLAPFGPAVTEEAKKAAEDAKAKIVSGELTIFKGPMKDNQGKVQIAEGQSLTPEEASSKMDWLVEGVEGSAK
ncbi:BMP family ABC transporter substrate-binding protein [Propylenella binzhouense]|nr:BMP family ABC transporter substrate-binding protein [Propylenella binzhouense]